MYRQHRLILLSFRLLIVFSLGMVVLNIDSQNSNNTRSQIYQIIRNIDPTLAIEGDWRELWQTYDSDNNLLEMVVVNGEITPDEINATCDYIWRDTFTDAYQYTMDGELVENVDLNATQAELLLPFQEQTNYISTQSCESTSATSRNAFDTSQCDFVGNDVIPSLSTIADFTGARWTENNSNILVSYMASAQNNEVNFATRFDFMVNDVRTNEEIVLDCFDGPLPLPENSVVRAYTPQGFAVVDTLNTIDTNQGFFISTLQSGSWIPAPGSQPTDNPQRYIGGIGGLCQLDIAYQTYPTTPNTNTVEISVVSNDVSTTAITNIAEAATNSPVVSAGVTDLDGNQQRLTGNVRENAETLLEQFLAERWVIHEALTIIYDDTALITLINDNYILHIFLEDIGSEQVEARYQLRELTCGSTFYPPFN